MGFKSIYLNLIVFENIYLEVKKYIKFYGRVCKIYGGVAL